MQNEILQLKVSDVQKAYQDGDASNKRLLEKMAPHLFGNILDRISSFEDICQIAGEDPKDYEIPKNPTSRQIRSVAHARIELAIEVVHESKGPDYSDKNLYKYEPIFTGIHHGPAGFGFSGAGSYCDPAGTYVGSRFAKRELAEFVGKLMVKEYYWLITGKLD